MHGADAILLIAAILDLNQLRDYQSCAWEYGMDVLVDWKWWKSSKSRVCRNIESSGDCSISVQGTILHGEACDYCGCPIDFQSFMYKHLLKIA